MARFQPGQPKPANSGRKAGTTNKSITKAREAFALAFEQIGGVEELARWARANRSDFYKLYARTLPLELTGEGGGPIKTTFAEAVKAAGIPAPLTHDEQQRVSETQH